MRPATPTDATALALIALASTLSDERRAQRFLELSGLSPNGLRERAAEPAVLIALLGFLEAHEPDLLAVAEEVGVEPAALASARRRLESGE